MDHMNYTGSSLSGIGYDGPPVRVYLPVAAREAAEGFFIIFVGGPAAAREAAAREAAAARAAGAAIRAAAGAGAPIRAAAIDAV